MHAASKGVSHLVSSCSVVHETVKVPARAVARVALVAEPCGILRLKTHDVEAGRLGPLSLLFLVLNK